MLEERRTRDEWEKVLSDKQRKITIEEFQLIEMYQAAGSLHRIEKLLVKLAPMLEKIGHVSDMFSIWTVHTVQMLRSKLPIAAEIVPPYPDSILGRMDLKDAQRIHELEIERRHEILAAAEEKAVVDRQ